MHRHGYKGRKFHRERDQRTALKRGLAVSLIEHGSIETTLPKAKEVSPYVEKLITKAKRADLHSRRQVLASLSSVSSTNKLVDEIAPKLKSRSSGYLRINKTNSRRGDNAQLARISFVDDLKAEAPKPTKETTVKPAAKTAKTTAKPKAAVKKPAPKKETK